MNNPTFGQPGYTGQLSTAPAFIEIGYPRKDGKVPVRYVYPSSGRSFNKLLTPAQVAAERDSGKYAIR